MAELRLAFDSASRLSSRLAARAQCHPVGSPRAPPHLLITRRTASNFAHPTSWTTPRNAKNRRGAGAPTATTPKQRATNLPPLPKARTKDSPPQSSTGYKPGPSMGPQIVMWSGMKAATAASGLASKSASDKIEQGKKGERAAVQQDVNHSVDHAAYHSGPEATVDLKSYAPKAFFRRKPETGRMVYVRSGGLAPALGLLSRLVRESNVRGDMIRQREYERPGLRKKRLKSERWRKTFREGFKQAIRRANELAKMGW